MTPSVAGTLDRLEGALRTIRVLRVGGEQCTGDDLVAVRLWKARCIESFGTIVNECICILDDLAGDPDFESDPFNEGEPEFGTAARAMVNRHEDDLVNGDEQDASWHEGYSRRAEPLKKRGLARLRLIEDAEDDDPAEVTSDEGEPDFRKRHKRLLRAAYGPGCMISDSDHGSEEAGEPEESGIVPQYGTDQRRMVHWAGQRHTVN